jgi:putative N6-adenine-specific DNA methylase
MADPFEIFLTAPPGLEPVLLDEVQALGFPGAAAVPGGVTLPGDWATVRRANLTVRGTGRVLARIASFRAMHLAQLDKRARKVDWAATLRPDVPVAVEATCRASRVYHAGAASQRVARAIAETLGAPIDTGAGEGGMRVMVRIEDDLCTLSVDTSGEALHRRGSKTATAKAPMRETLAALFLRACGYRGQWPVVDPMCGSGSFVIEAAEAALGLPPGRARDFAFEQLATHDAVAWEAEHQATTPATTDLRFHGSDRDAGAIRSAIANADRAGVGGIATFTRAAVSDLTRPDGPPGLVIVNPPYGHRIGERQPLFALYGALGATLMQRFRGWRVGLITTDAGLARATGLPWHEPGPIVDHGGLKVRLWQAGPL